MSEKPNFESELFQQNNLTAEFIKEQTDFELQALYPSFNNDNGYVTPQIHDDRERLSEEYGESNVLTSFLISDGKIMLGLFLRRKTP